MNNSLRPLFGGLTLAFAMIGSAQADAHSPGPLRDDSPNIYVMSNDIRANSIAVLRRNFFGGLDKIAVVATGGKGVGAGTTAPPPDPLGSQNALLRSQDGRWLFASNAGSNQVSAFAIRHGTLRLVDVVSSGGTYPVSLAQRGNRLYVLNSARVASVDVFQIDPDGQLDAIDGASRLIGTDQPLVGNQPNVGMTPAQLQFSPDGQWLAISVKDASAKGYFELFAVDRHGNLAQDPAISPSNDPQPFGFSFDSNGHLVTSQATNSAASSYAIARDGTLRAISTDVANGQAAACWLTVSGHYAYTSNAGKNNISAYHIDNAGRLSLATANGVSATLEQGAAPTDIKASADGRFLYVLNSLAGNIDTFLIVGGGHLLQIADTPVFPAASGMQGLAL